MPSLQGKIRTGYSALAAAVAGLALLAYSDLSYLGRHLTPDLAASRLLDTTLEIRRYEKNWFLYGGDAALAEVRGYAAEAEGLIEAARSELAGPIPETELERLAAGLARYREALAALPAAPPGEAEEGPGLALRQAGRALTEEAEGIARARHARLQAALAQSRAVLLATAVVAVLLAGSAARWLAGRTVRPLRALVTRFGDIAAGRYDQVTPVSSDREILAVTQAVNRMLAELEARRRHLMQSEKLASLGTLISGVAHELNNPLSNISTSAQLLAEEWDSAEPELKREWLAQIEGETERVRDIVRGLLDFSREGVFNRQPVALGPLAEQTLRLVTGAACGADLACEVPAGLVIAADPRRLQQVLVNLIRNALDAGGPGVRVRLRAEMVEAAGFRMPEHSVCGRSGVPDLDSGRLVLLSVQDDGPGIPLELLPRVFDPFFTTKDVGQGSGLGLYVSQELVCQHGGCIGVSSSPGAGTRFTIALPQAAGA